MLIPVETVKYMLSKHNIEVTGVLHVGAHKCEEIELYSRLGLEPNDVVWIDAIEKNVIDCRNRGIPNLYTATVSDQDDMDVVLNVSNNVQSSSILEFGTHSTEHPHVVYVDKINTKSVTIDSFFKRNEIDPSKYNFWNLDIQGAELMALKGAPHTIGFVKVMYLEVNEKELYKGCGQIGEIDEFLAKHGFKRVFTKMLHHGWGDAIYVKD